MNRLADYGEMLTLVKFRGNEFIKTHLNQVVTK